MKSENLLDTLPADLPEELFTTILMASRFRVERIVSHGHASPPGFRAISFPASANGQRHFSSGSLSEMIARLPISLVIVTPFSPLLPLMMACLNPLPSKIDGSVVAKLQAWT